MFYNISFGFSAECNNFEETELSRGGLGLASRISRRTSRSERRSSLPPLRSRRWRPLARYRSSRGWHHRCRRLCRMPGLYFPGERKVENTSISQLMKKTFPISIDQM